MTQAIIRQARTVILVTDSMKLERSAPVKVGTLSDIDIMVTDDGISAEFFELCQQHNVDLKIAQSAV